MILEAIVITLTSSEEPNISPMGPLVDDVPFHEFILRPYITSRTLHNLQRHREGTLHITDDALLLAQAAIGQIDQPPELVPTQHVRGFRLADTCRWIEFAVTDLDDSRERTTIRCSVVHEEMVRPFFGFNRAKHAVVEAAILATRIAFLPIQNILDDFDRLDVLVEKTGGEREHMAMRLLRDYVEKNA